MIRAYAIIGTERFMFDNYELYKGLNFMPVLLGMFALSELMIQSQSLNKVIERTDQGREADVYGGV